MIAVTALIPAAFGWVAWVTKTLIEVKTALTLTLEIQGFKKPFKRHIRAFEDREVKR